MSNTHISIPLGIVIGLLASFVQSLGLTIQRKSHVLNQRLPQSQQRVEHRRPLWLLGFTIFITSNILGSLVQIASLPVVILAPLGAVSLLWNAFFGRFLLGDVFSLWMVLGTLLIAGGAVLIAIFGIVPEATRSLEDLLELFERPAFIVYFSSLGFLLILALLISHVTEHSLRRRLLTSSPLPIALPDNPSALMTSVANAPTERTSLLDRKTLSPSPSVLLSKIRASHATSASVERTRLLLAVSYASVSGILSGMCLLFAKSGVELLLLTVRGKNQFWRWEPWMLVLGLVAFALLQLWYLHKALILANPTLVCPMAFCFYNLSSIINGLVYFNQFTLISPIHLFLVVVGIVVLLAGVWVVAIQSGEGGVDLGTWHEAEETLSDGECEEDVVEPSAIDNPMDQATERVDTEQGRGDMIPTSNIVPILLPPPVPTTGGLGLGYPSALRRTSLASTRPDISPGQPSRSISSSSALLLPRRRGTTFDPAHPPSFLLRRPPPSMHTRPLSQVSFQIGLSPVSPGFMIMPRERRRRISGSTWDDDRLAGGVNTRRRTVSEGDLRRQLALAEQVESNEDGFEGGGHGMLEAEGSGGGDRRNGTAERDHPSWAWW